MYTRNGHSATHSSLLCVYIYIEFFFEPTIFAGFGYISPLPNTFQ